MYGDVVFISSIIFSEEILVANNQPCQFNYLTGVIEDNEIKDKIVNILEG
ncbi:MAG: hypothetical protein LBG52_04560 [Candidatus Peribacteria bacterium]|nr:hypothetical protein [Candidatus Peribacteria bacterium]